MAATKGVKGKMTKDQKLWIDNGTVTVIIEIPKGSRNKYEYDQKTGRIKFDRMLFSSVHYPSDYGFVDKTIAGDGDPLDALVLMWEPTFPGCVIEAKPIGILNMEDEKGQDEKLLCVPLKDPIWRDVETLKDLPPHLLKELKNFFAVYKDLEGKKTVVLDWEGKDKAWRVIHESMKRYNNYIENTYDKKGVEKTTTKNQFKTKRNLFK